MEVPEDPQAGPSLFEIEREMLSMGQNNTIVLLSAVDTLKEAHRYLSSYSSKARPLFLAETLCN
jgi:hypothetical protein